MTDRISKVLLEYARAIITGKSSEHRFQRKLQIAVSWIIKIGVSGLALLYIYSKLEGESLIIESTLSSLFALSSVHLTLYSLAAVFLISANWGLEMVKWNMLIAPKFDSRWTTAVKGVLSGATFGVFTPNRLGEFLGRVLALGPNQRIPGSVLSIVNGLSQTLATLSFGVVGCLFILEYLGISSLGVMAVRILQVTLIAFWIVSVVLYFNVDLLGNLVERWKRLSFLSKHLLPLSNLSSMLLHKLYALSILRFLTFLGQYFLVFSLLLGEPDWVIIGGVSMLSLFSATVFSIVPIPDLILREAIAISYFGLFEFDLKIVSAVVFIVWVLNVAIPALVGSVVLLTYKIFRPT